MCDIIIIGYWGDSMGTGNKGRFSDRLKKISLSKRKKNDGSEETGNVKRTLLVPIMLLENLVKGKTKEIKLLKS